jgi:hypothetical protein
LNQRLAPPLGEAARPTSHTEPVAMARSSRHPVLMDKLPDHVRLNRAAGNGPGRRLGAARTAPVGAGRTDLEQLERPRVRAAAGKRCGCRAIPVRDASRAEGADLRTSMQQ